MVHMLSIHQYINTHECMSKQPTIVLQTHATHVINTHEWMSKHYFKQSKQLNYNILQINKNILKSFLQETLKTT